MVFRDTPWPTGTPCWVDLAVPDVSAATAFYGAVLGWTFVDSGAELGHYHIAQARGRAAAAIGPVMSPGQTSAWTVYLATDDADTTAKMIDQCGGTLLFEPMDIPGTGRMAVALDPAGSAFGIWQPLGLNGAEIAAEPGALTWTDVRLTDVEAGRDFYTAVFGYHYLPVPGAPDGYATIDLGDEPVGGLVGTPDGVASHWLCYFSVADVDVACAVAARAGAQVLIPPEDTEFGRIGVITDPFGATLALHEDLPAR